ncbi:MAG: hypothetical protein GX786_00585 [Clostridiales bacterium]|nr:hypothetical protein [Clostridiales bacterium]
MDRGNELQLIPQSKGAKETVMTKERLSQGQSKLQEYTITKAKLDQRLVENNRWWEMRHWDSLETDGKQANQKSAWLLNSLLNKHADAMDNYPEANIMPREESDKETAKILTSVLPTMLEHNDFEEVYSGAWWDKLKSGTAVYGVFWNPEKGGGLGDIDIVNVDMLGLFWEPGIDDIQDSEHVFHCAMVDAGRLNVLYPQLKNKQATGNSLAMKRYDDEQTVKDNEKSLVVDWYYKQDGKLHYCKYVGDEVLYCSEDVEEYIDEGFYADGNYPFVFDVMFPKEESPAGFGFLDTMKDVQERIDKVGTGLTRNAYLRSKQRFWVKEGAGVNEEEFSDFDKDFVHISANQIGEAVGQIQVDPIGADVTAIYTHWIEELKETSGNRDVSQGGTQSGVTAASAIAALQEAASKLTRDMLKTSYRSFQKLCYMVIERIRQFYDLPRTFRIIGQGGEESFESFDNQGLMMETEDAFGMISQRKPVFDIKIAPQKSSPYTKIAQNELALNFYDRGFFAPANADPALACLDMMDFDGKEKVIGRIQKNGTLLQMVEQLQQALLQQAMIIENAMPGQGMLEGAAGMVQQQRMMMGGGQGAGQGQAAGFVKTDSLGNEISASDKAARTRAKVAHQSDPNGGAP